MNEQHHDDAALTTVKVAGMSCGHCVAAVTKELTALGGVSEVSVDLEAGAVSFRSDRELGQAELAAAIDEAGFDLVT